MRELVHIQQKGCLNYEKRLSLAMELEKLTKIRFR